MKALYAADLFCGAGGASTGAVRACDALGRKVKLAAVNHWARAVETHAKNHPDAAHFCEDLASLDPKKAVPGGRLDLLIAAPECTHHSVARGGKPVNDQSRASAWCVLRWCTALMVDRVLIENVPEFQSWGPIGANGKPLASKKGETFRAFVSSLSSLGYTVEWRVLNAADFGGATSRKRLFIQAVRGRRPIRWPEPTHGQNPTPDLFGGSRLKWRAAREIIDWTLPGDSIFTRKRPLSENTLKRIEAGLRKFGGANAEPFLVMLRRHGEGRSINLPVPTVCAGGGHVALCEPFLTSFNGKPEEDRRTHDAGNPLPTQHCSNRFGLCEPFIVSAGGPKVDARPVSQPTNTVLTRDHMALVEPFIIGRGHPNANGSYVYDPDGPLPTVTTVAEHGVVEPFVVHTTHHGERRVHGTDDPLPCVTGANRGEQALVQPFIVPQMSSNGPRSVDDPAPTLTTTSRGVGLCEPFVTAFYGNGGNDAVADPLRTVTTKDRFGLCEPQNGARLDIRFRMLQPHELAAAMGFPRDYQITGNRGEQVRQIGNAVVVEQAEALVRAMLCEDG